MKMRTPSLHSGLMRSLFVLVLILAFIAPSYAKMPVQRLFPRTVGVEFSLAERRQAITQALVPSTEELRLISAHYAPFPGLALSLGVGGDRFSVDRYQNKSFTGGYGFTPMVGAHLASPVFLDKFVRICADFQALYLNSSDEFGFEYKGVVLDPSAGLLLHLGPWVSLEAGGRWHVINGTMQSGDDNSETPFSNDPYFRGYLALSAVSLSGVFIRIDFAAAEGAIDDRFQDGLDETALALEIGLLIFPDDRLKKTQERNSRYFPSYDKMKEREKELEKKMKSPE